MAPGGHARGFTLVELLVVVAVIALLVAMLFPTLGRAKEESYSALCRSNLRQLWETFNAGTAGSRLRFPQADTWPRQVVDAGAGAVMSCPKEPRNDTGMSGLEDVYIDHFHCMSVHLHVYLLDVFELPQNVEQAGGTFEQIMWRENGGAKEVFLFGSNGLRITQGSPTVIEGIPHPRWSECNTLATNSSTHHLMKGDQMIMRMLGIDNLVEPDPLRVVLAGGSTSYGMNNQVQTLPTRGDQLLLLDYVKTVADVDGRGNNDDLLSNTLPVQRHMGKVNLISADGAARAAWPSELAPTDLWTP